jgi:alkylation response protein AidB-like acyl-CoA dehydrogenase
MTFELSRDQQAWQERVAAFAAERIAPRAGEIDASGEFPEALVREAAALGLLGLTVSTTWGGQGRDYVRYALAVEALARASAVMAVIVAVTNSLVAEPIAQFGTDAQKETWLRRWRAARRSAPSPCRRSTPDRMRPTSRPSPASTRTATACAGAKVWVANAAAADWSSCSPPRSRACAAAASAPSSCRWTRRPHARDER